MDLGSLVRRLVPGARAGGDGRASSPGASQPVQRLAAPAGPTGAWRSLPALRPTAGDAPLVAPTAPFRARLATAQRAPVALEALGHGRGLEAPAGLASGIAAPVETLPGEPLPTSVRRARARRHADAGDGPAAWPDSEVGVESGDGLPATSSAASSSASDEPATVAPGRAAAAPTPRSPLVSAAPVGPTPVGRLGAGAAAAQLSAREAMPSAGSEPSASREAALPMVAREAGTTAPAAGGAPEAPIVPTPGAVRRIRLGSPLARPGATTSPGAAGTAPIAAAGPAPTTPTTPVAAQSSAAPTSGVGPVPGAPTPPASPDVVAVPGVSRLATAGAAGETPAAADVVSLDASADPTAATEALTAARSVVRPWSTPTTVRRSVAPVVGTLRPAMRSESPAVAMRSAAASTEPAAASAEYEPGTPTAALAALARVDPSAAPGAALGPGAGPHTGVAQGPLASFGEAEFPGGQGAPFAVARAADDVSGPSPARLTWSNPWLPAGASPSPGVAPRDVERPAATLPARPATAGPAQIVAARDAAVPTVLPPVGFTPRLSALRVGPAVGRSAGRPAGDTAAAREAAPGPSAAADGPASSPAAMALVARSVTESAPVTLAPLQRADAGEEAPPPGASPEGVPGAGAAPGGGPAAGASPGAGGDKELDELARKLYDRIGMRLRREMLVERERAGALVDRGF